MLVQWLGFMDKESSMVLVTKGGGGSVHPQTSTKQHSMPKDI